MPKKSVDLLLPYRPSSLGASLSRPRKINWSTGRLVDEAEGVGGPLTAISSDSRTDKGSAVGLLHAVFGAQGIRIR